MSNLHPNSFAGEGSTQLPRSDSFHNNGSFFNGKDALQISIRSLAYSAPGAVRATEVLPCSNLRPDFRSLRLNRSNLEPIYQQARELVIWLKGGSSALLMKFACLVRNDRMRDEVAN